MVDKEKFYILFQKKKKNQIGTGVQVHPPSVPVHPAQKEAVAKVYRYTTNVYRYMRPVFGKIGFLTQNFVPFDIPNSPPLSIKPNPSLFAQVHLSMPGFPSLRPGFSCTLCTDVVSLLKLLESSFGAIHYYTWTCLVGFG